MNAVHKHTRFKVNPIGNWKPVCNDFIIPLTYVRDVAPATKRAAAFRTRCSGASVLVGRPASTALQKSTLDSMKADARRCADAVSINERSFRKRRRWKKQVDDILLICTHIDNSIYMFLQTDITDVRKTLQTFPAGSSGSPDGITP